MSVQGARPIAQESVSQTSLPIDQEYWEATLLILLPERTVVKHMNLHPREEECDIQVEEMPTAHLAWHFLQEPWASLCPSLARRSLVNGTFLEIKDRMFSHLPSLQLL